MIYERHLINGEVTHYEITINGAVTSFGEGAPYFKKMTRQLEAGTATLVDVDDTPPPPTVRERRAERYRTELSNGNPTEVEALADTVSALITEAAEVRQNGIELVDYLKTHGIGVPPNLFGEMTPNLAERIEKIAIIQAEEV